jgi:hypothetical protein
MDYYIKYLKYKKKYLLYKKKYLLLCKQFGKGIEHVEISRDENWLSNWKLIPNSGQHNCGLYINSTKDRVLVCRNKEMDLNLLEYYKNIREGKSLINSEYKITNDEIIPTLYFINKISDKYYYESKKLDGDITQMLFDIIPNLLSQQNKYNDYSKEIIKIFRFKSMSYFNIQKNKETIHKELKEINDRIPDIDIKIYTKLQEKIESRKKTYGDNYERIEKKEQIENSPKNFIELYKSFIDHLANIIRFRVLPKLLYEIYKLLEKIIKIGYTYEDYKFDNFGYLYNENTKKFDYYILDIESGLFKIENKYEIESLLNTLEKRYNNNFSNMSANGENIFYTQFQNIIKFEDLNNLNDILIYKKQIDYIFEEPLPYFVDPNKDILYMKIIYRNIIEAPISYDLEEFIKKI